jgi:hypothetical protein
MRWGATAALAMAGEARRVGDVAASATMARCEARARELGMETVTSAVVVVVEREMAKEAGVETATGTIAGTRQRRAGKRVAAAIAGAALAVALAVGVRADGPVPAATGAQGGVYRAEACWRFDATRARVCVVGESEDDEEAIDLVTELVPDGYRDAGVAVVVTVRWLPETKKGGA